MRIDKHIPFPKEWKTNTMLRIVDKDAPESKLVKTYVEATERMKVGDSIFVKEVNTTASRFYSKIRSGAKARGVKISGRKDGNGVRTWRVE